MAYAAFVFVCLNWGSTFILMERVSHALGPVEIGIWRLLLGAAALFAIWWWKRDEYRLSRQDIGWILFSALVANVPPYVTQPYVLAQGYGHSFFGVAVAAIPLLTMLMSIPMLGIWPTKRQMVGVIGGLLCLWFVVEDGFDRGMSIGLLALAAVVPITASFNNTFIKLKLPHAQPLPLTAVMLGSAGLMLLPLEFCSPAIKALDLAGPLNPELTPLTIAYLIVLGVVTTGISTVAFFYMVLQRGPLFAGMTTYVVPMLAFAWGLFDHETINLRQLAAMAGVLVMVGIVQSGSERALESNETAPADLPDGGPAIAIPPPHAFSKQKLRSMPVAFGSISTPDDSVCDAPATSA
jgi:drug/metabolite transporter (DMT)-like permease